jgi:hypothetical protein
MNQDASREARHVHSLTHTPDDARGVRAPRRQRPKHAGAVSKVALAWRRPRGTRAATAPGHPLQGMEVSGAQRGSTAQPAILQLLMVACREVLCASATRLLWHLQRRDCELHYLLPSMP